MKGFTLIELMIVVAIVAIISAVALPMYTGYIETSRQGALVNNISTIELFQEDFRLRTGNYLLVAANAAAIKAAIGWDPQDDAAVTYAIASTAANTYNVTATDDSGTTVCMRFPAKVRC
jgi:type IV pilus assembly protein PilE